MGKKDPKRFLCQNTKTQLYENGFWVLLTLIKS